MQKILTIVVAILMIYTIINTKIKQSSTNTVSKPVEAIQKITSTDTDKAMEGNFLEKSLSNVLVNVLKTPEGRTFFENMIQPVDTKLDNDGTGLVFDYTQIVRDIFRTKTYGTGTIGPATCGYTVTAQYEILTVDNVIVDQDTQTFRLGEAKVISALENLIIGMYVGQTREGVAISKYAYDNPRFQGVNKKPSLNYKIKVTLLDMEPKIFLALHLPKIFDDRIAYQIPCLCGEHVVFDIKLSKIDGTVIYDSEQSKETLSMHLGDDSYPMIFSYALFGKAPASTRTVIAQAQSLQCINNKLGNGILRHIQIPKNEFILIEFKNTAHNSVQ